MRILKVSSALKSHFDNQGTHLDTDKDMLIFLATVSETFLLKIDIKQYHLEVLDILDITFNEMYQTESGFVFILDSKAIYVPYSDFFSSDLKQENEEIENKVIASSHSQNILVCYHSDKFIRFYAINNEEQTSYVVDSPVFVHKVTEEEQVSHLSLNSNLLMVAFRKTGKHFNSIYEVKAFIVEDKALKYLYTIPIWAEDVNDKTNELMHLTHFSYENDVLQYVYNNKIAVQRKAELKTLNTHSKYSDTNEVSC